MALNLLIHDGKSETIQARQTYTLIKSRERICSKVVKTYEDFISQLATKHERISLGNETEELQNADAIQAAELK